MLPDIQPGNTKILYFFNCLLDGMHTKIKHICDFSRCRLNVRVNALTSNLCSEATNMLYLSKEGCILAGEEIAIYKPLHKSIFLGFNCIAGQVTNTDYLILRLHPFRQLYSYKK